MEFELVVYMEQSDGEDVLFWVTVILGRQEAEGEKVDFYQTLECD